MANYECITQSSSFKVNSKKELEDFFDGLVGEDVNVDIMEKDGEVYGSFCGYSDIVMYDESNGEYSFDLMCKEIQNILHEDDYCWIKTIGNEKLRFIDGDITFITKTDIEYVSLFGLKGEFAKEFKKAKGGKING